MILSQSQRFHIALSSLLLMFLSGCAVNNIEFDPQKPHHGINNFVSKKDPSFFGHMFMRMKEEPPEPRDPEEVASIVGEADLELIASPADQPRVTWIGHATALVQYRDINYLTDPHLTQFPFEYEMWVEPRYTQPALTFEQMPQIDFVVISHNHYDSLDHRTVDMFGDSVMWYVPLGLKAWFLKRGISEDRVVELDWWEDHAFSPEVTVTLTPAEHWSRRTAWDANKTLWGGWTVRIDDFNSYFVGDTGYHPEYFRDIGERLGPFDLALIPIGAYAPRYFMESVHIDPAQAVDVHLEAKAEQSMAIHWGTFQLTIEPILEPRELLESELKNRNIPQSDFRAVKVGDTLILN